MSVPADYATIAKPFTSLGKQVLEDGQHFADARDPEAAALIAIALNRQADMLDGIVERLMQL